MRKTHLTVYIPQIGTAVAVVVSRKWALGEKT